MTASSFENEVGELATYPAHPARCRRTGPGAVAPGPVQSVRVRSGCSRTAVSPWSAAGLVVPRDGHRLARGELDGAGDRERPLDREAGQGGGLVLHRLLRRADLGALHLERRLLDVGV